MATVVDFKIRFPEYDSEPDARIQLFLDDTALIMKSSARWLSFYEPAHLYYTAHFLATALHTESGDSGIMAPSKQQEVDDVVIVSAIGDIEPTFDELNSTAYGKRFLFYRNMCFMGIRGV
jgi:hypothetical protein